MTTNISGLEGIYKVGFRRCFGLYGQARQSHRWPNSPKIVQYRGFMLFFTFLLALSALFVQCIIVPKIAILAFAPYLASLILRCTLNKALIFSAIAGAIIDILSNDPMGIHALNYVIVSACFYKIRSHFSYDNAMHLSFFSAMVSLLSTILHLFTLFLFDRRVPFSGQWVFADLIGMPMIDMLYAFVWFAAPLAFVHTLKRFWVLFWLKKKNRSLTSH